MNIIKKWRFISRANRNVKAFGFDINKITVKKEGIEIIAMIPGRCEKAGKCWRPGSRLYPWSPR